MIVHDPGLDDARRQLDVSMMELWVGYFALGGHLDASDLASYLRADRDVTNTEHNIVAHVLNEFYSDRGQNRPLTYLPV